MRNRSDMSSSWLGIVACVVALSVLLGMVAMLILFIFASYVGAA